MTNNLFEDPRLASIYDVARPKRLDFSYCTRLAQSAASVLDLGCGTGALAVLLAQQCTVTGVESARAMLDIARMREGAEHVRWIEADARAIRLEERFDLVVLTGHTFQVFLSDADQVALLATIATHLAPCGRFVFDTRNPAIGVREHRNRVTYPNILDVPPWGRVEQWNGSRYDAKRSVLSYTNGYRLLDTGEELTGQAEIRYTKRDELANRIAQAGLSVDEWLGTWDGSRFEESVSPEIIAIGRLTSQPPMIASA